MLKKSENVKNVRKCQEMSENVRKCQKMSENIIKCHKMSKNIKNISKCQKTCVSKGNIREKTGFAPCALHSNENVMDDS